MPIPDYQSIMLPLLKLVEDTKEHSLRGTIDSLADQYKLTDEERQVLLPSGQQSIFDNRVGWARTYLKKAGLIDSTRRGFFKISNRGLDLLKQSPNLINSKALEQFEEFVDFKTKRDKVDQTIDIYNEQTQSQTQNQTQTPEEILEFAYQKIRNELASDILQKIKACSPAFFERLVVELLVKIGYGGTRQDAGKAIGKSGDGGIDGIIKEDRLGLDVIYIQAKRWEGVVSRPEIQKFAGALQGQRAKKGVFITTSSYTKEAKEYVAFIDSKIILIDGMFLATLMIDNNVGVSSIASYEIKKVDSDYFADE